MGFAQKVSLSDVAKAAGVSAQTVSRVVNGGDKVSPARREKVLKAMQTLGYRPNLAARALKRGSFKTIGIALFDISATGNIQTLQGISKAATEKGYALLFNTYGISHENTVSSAVRKMSELPLDGILIALEKMTADIDSYQPSPDMPVELITSYPSQTMSTTDSNQYQASVTVVDYFLARGHRQVHYVSGPEDSIANRYRQEGWADTLRAHGLEPPACLTGDWGANSGYEAGLRLAQFDSCTAVYAANDAMANGVIAGLEASGKSVPGDVSVIGVDNSLEDVMPKLSLSSMDLHTATVSYQAFVGLAERIESRNRLDNPADDPHEVIQHRLLPGRLVERASVRQLAS